MTNTFSKNQSKIGKNQTSSCAVFLKPELQPELELELEPQTQLQTTTVATDTMIIIAPAAAN